MNTHTHTDIDTNTLILTLPYTDMKFMTNRTRHMDAHTEMLSNSGSHGSHDSRQVHADGDAVGSFYTHSSI